MFPGITFLYKLNLVKRIKGKLREPHQRGTKPWRDIKEPDLKPFRILTLSLLVGEERDKNDSSYKKNK